MYIMSIGGGERYATTSLVRALRHKCIYLCDLSLPSHNEPVRVRLDTRASGVRAVTALDWPFPIQRKTCFHTLFFFFFSFARRLILCEINDISADLTPVEFNLYSQWYLNAERSIRQSSVCRSHFFFFFFLEVLNIDRQGISRWK